VAGVVVVMDIDRVHDGFLAATSKYGPVSPN